MGSSSRPRPGPGPRASDAPRSRSPELLVDFRRQGPRRRARLEAALRQTVRSGRLSPGQTMPSSRALADRLGVSRRLVVEAYSQLVAEGYLRARPGAATRVAGAPPSPRPPLPAPPRRDRAPRWDLFAGHPDLTLFPRAAWVRALREALVDLPAVRLGYGWPAGAPELRRALADHLGRVRGASAVSQRILVFSGYLHALGVLCRVLARRGVTDIALEDPGFPLGAAVVRSCGLGVVPVAVDGEGMQTHRLYDLGVGAVVVTPAHSFPSGVVLAPGRRAELLRWAHERDGIVIEDDYDGDFRYDREPVGTLQGVSPERVVLAGSASKSLAPAVRLGWLLVPEELVSPVLAERSLGGDAAALDQLALAGLMAGGAYDRHLRACRGRYRRKRATLLAALEQALPGARVGGVAAGLHVVLWLPAGADELVVARAAEQRGLRVYPLRHFRAPPAAGDQALVLGYAALSERELSAAAVVLAEAVTEAQEYRGGVGRRDRAEGPRPASMATRSRRAGTQEDR